MKTVRLTMAQALVKYLVAQKTIVDGAEAPLFAGVFAIFGHGNVTCLGEALYEVRDVLPTWRGQNEQSMTLAAIAYGKAKLRRQIMVSSSSVGPGATNMLTAAATAHSNRLPVLILAGDVFAGRIPDPVLQQVEHFDDPTMSVNDAFRAVSRFWDRINRPEQLVASLPQAVAVMLDPADCGPAFIGLPQDTQAEAYDYPEVFFEPTVHLQRRPRPDTEELVAAAQALRGAKKPLVISGGGVIYSQATAELAAFVERHNLPVAETIAGRGGLTWDHPCNIGPIGSVASSSGNAMAAEADCVFAVGTRLQDFTTGSWSVFGNPEVRVVSLNAARFDAVKHRAISVIGDAQVGLTELDAALGDWQAPASWCEKATKEVAKWNAYIDQVTGPTNQSPPSYGHVVGAINRAADPSDRVLTAAGGLVAEVLKCWRVRASGAFDVEFGFSCMGYEIAGGLGSKMANPEREVVIFVGDGSYLMMNSEIYSSVITGHKLIIVVCDNGGFAVIRRLQNAVGSASFNNLFEHCKTTNYVPADFAKHAEGLGAIAETVEGIGDLEQAFQRARSNDRTTVIVIKTHPEQWTGGDDAWWDVGVPEVSGREEVRAARADYESSRKKQRVGV